MTICALIGDSDIPETMRKNIREALYMLIINFGVDFFYVGADGNFDIIAEEELYELCRKYPKIGYNVIVSEVPYKEYSPEEIYERNLCPIFDFENSSKNKLIEKSSRWMIKEAEYVLIHTRNPDSKAEKLKKYARSENKKIILLCGK